MENLEDFVPGLRPVICGYCVIISRSLIQPYIKRAADFDVENFIEPLYSALLLGFGVKGLLECLVSSKSSINNTSLLFMNFTYILGAYGNYLKHTKHNDTEFNQHYPEVAQNNEEPDLIGTLPEES